MPRASSSEHPRRSTSPVASTSGRRLPDTHDRIPDAWLTG
jgi:hypothetical protein